MPHPNAGFDGQTLIWKEDQTLQTFSSELLDCQSVHFTLNTSTFNDKTRVFSQKNLTISVHNSPPLPGKIQIRYFQVRMTVKCMLIARGKMLKLRFDQGINDQTMPICYSITK